MKSVFLLYETEQMIIKVIEPKSIIYEPSTNISGTRQYIPSTHFRVELHHEYDFNSIKDTFELDSGKYIKQHMTIIDEEKLLHMDVYGCFPTEYNMYENRFEIYFDYMDAKVLDVNRKYIDIIKTYKRNERLKSIGIS